MKTGYIIPHTHWDREWRYPIWENRMYLVNFMDELLDIFEKEPEYKSFLMDGQTVAMLDYLEVRPEKEATIKQYIKDGRILVGPWYTLPDLYPVSGESLIRNLLMGRRTAEKLGRCMKIGYESFGWGQTAQFPQIYKGFGIDTVFISKNVDEERAPEAEFIWKGEDGTEILATRLGKDARANFFMNAYLQIMNGMEYKGSDYRYRIDRQGMVFHQAGEDGYHEDYFVLENSEFIRRNMIVEAILRAWKMTDVSVLPDKRVMMDGCDSTTSQPYIVELVKVANKELEANNIDIRLQMSDLYEYEYILKTIDPASLRTIKGELRDGPCTALSANALMTRPQLKQLNKKVQNTLFRCAEPFSTAVCMLGGKRESIFLEKAVQYLLLSHPHDSINGVTQDKTVDDVMYMLNQSLELSKTVYQSCCKEIMRMVDTSAYETDANLLMLLNPLPNPRREIIKVYLDTPRDKAVWDFDLLDADGNRLDTQFISREEALCPVSDLHARPWPMYCDRHCLYVDTGDIPAGGYTLISLKKKSSFNRDAVFWPQTRKTDGQELAKTATCMENEYLRVEVKPDGSLSILDKPTGVTYSGLNYFQDEGDCGDYWMYYPPYNNQTYSSKGCAASISLEDNGKLSATITAEIVMELPAYAYRPENGIKGKSARSSEKKPVKITASYTLKRGSRQVDVKLSVDNTVKDHRMTVMFDTKIKAETVCAEGHFNVDKRTLLPLKDKDGEYYQELMTQPMQNFVDISDGARGLGIVSNSLLEYQAIPNDEATLSLTLFRSVRNIICTEMRSAGVFPNQQGGQVLQVLSYEYAICPHDGDFEKGELFDKANRLSVPVFPVQTSRQLQCGNLPASYSFYQIPAGLQMSCLKEAEDGQNSILRLYNPGSTENKGIVTMKGDISAVKEVMLDESELSPIKLDENSFEVIVPPNKIKTFKLMRNE